MEISENSLSVFYVSKLFALAPFEAHRNSKGAYDIKRSWTFTTYSVSLIVIMVVLTYRGLLFDANSELPVRMKSATSKVVTALDVSVVVLAATAGVTCGLLSLNATQELNARLSKIDNTLHCNNKRDRWRALLLIIAALTVIVTLLCLDIWTSIRLAAEMRTNTTNTVLNVKWYLPFYSLYFILTGIQVNFTNTAYGLGRRYCRLNKMLHCSFLSEMFEPKKQAKINSVKVIHFNTDTSHTLHSSMTKMKAETLANDTQSKKKSMLIRVLAENHESLGKCVMLVSSSYGITVLFILVSCLLHLVATAYFLFFALLSKTDNAYLWLQFLWLGFHTLRLLMVVEPCHLAASESRKTIQIVCEIERKVYEPILAEEIKKFWQELIAIQTNFSASGLCCVNRTILTSFASAIATYLVILIQFQKSDG